MSFATSVAVAVAASDYIASAFCFASTFAGSFFHLALSVVRVSLVLQAHVSPAVAGEAAVVSAR